MPLLFPPAPPSFSLPSPKFGARFLESSLGEDPKFTFHLENIEEGMIIGNVDVALDGPLTYEWHDDEMQFGVEGRVAMPDPVTISYDPRMYKLWRLDTLKLPRDSLITSPLHSRWND